MIIFNYIFYRISFIYRKYKIETINPEIYASGIISLCQTLNLLALLFLFFNLKISIPLLLIFGVPLLILNWIFPFNESKLKKLNERWPIENKKAKLFYDICIVLYIIVSFTLYGISAYLSKNG